jgi:hypothetical protein
MACAIEGNMTNTIEARRVSHAFALDALPAEYIARMAARRAAMVRAKQAERDSLRRLAQALQVAK